MENKDINLEEIIEEERVNVGMFTGRDYYDCYDCPNCGSQAAVNKRLPREKGDTI